jgi:hypothetical protein
MNTATNGIAVYAGRLVLGGENDLAGVGKISWRQHCQLLHTPLLTNGGPAPTLVARNST